MNQYLSDKIKLISLILILLVLYIHSGFKLEDSFYNNLVQNFIGGKLGALAVPTFFVISGYLFFLKTNKGLTSIKVKMKKRFKSVFLPYIYACILFVITFTSIQLIPGASKYINWNMMELYQKPILGILKDVFWIMGERNSPIAFHLWFLRDLILVILFSPLIYYVLRYGKWFAIIMLFIIASLNISIYPTSLIVSIFWFSLGGVFSIDNSKIVFQKRKWGFLLFFIYLILAYLKEYMDSGFYLHTNKLLIIIGMLGMWFLYDSLVASKFKLMDKKRLSYLCEYTFFIYLVHEPLINIVRKVLVIVLGKESLGYLLSYLLSPLITMILLAFIGSQIKKYIPKLYSNFVGGRV